jgi:hypothetical protein
MGGKFTHLRTVAARVLGFCEERGVRLVVEHLPGVQNKVADKLSRWPLDRSDWSLNRTVFRLLDSIWGPHTVDWFATRHNALLPRFATWCADEQATYIDALQCLHENENGFANPPFAVIGQIIQKVRQSNRDLTLIVPAWPSQHWWPTLLSLMSDTPLLLPNFPDLFLPPEGKDVYYWQLPPPWRCFAFRISGKSARRRVYRGRLEKLLYLTSDGPNLLADMIMSFSQDDELPDSTTMAVGSIIRNLVRYC